MTNNYEEEEKFLLDQLLGAREAVARSTKAYREAQYQKNRDEQFLETCRQAVIDYMRGNGCVETDNFILSETTSIDVPDIDAVPEQFVRVKNTREANKVLIRELKPEGNWFTIKHNDKLTLKAGE